jgi:hypothetical protein
MFFFFKNNINRDGRNFIKKICVSHMLLKNMYFSHVKRHMRNFIDRIE